jgi:hypothetical protein
MSQLPLYQIADWDRRFENSRSRTIDQCNFVCFRNEDGLTTSAITIHEGGAAILGIWFLLGKLCSRHGKPRQGYITRDGTRAGWRLGSEELAHMWRIPVAMVRRALLVLSSRQVGLINLIDGSPETAASAHELTPEPVTPPPATTADERHFGVTPPPASDADERQLGVTPPPSSILSDVNERKKEGMKEPPLIPQGGIETDFHRESHSETDLHGEENTHNDQNFELAKQWINSLFGRQRSWNYEESELLSRLLPISRDDRALLSWAYTLPRNAEGWVVVDGERLNKPKSSSLILLRELSAEIDKWKSVRANLNGAEEYEPPQGNGWTEERVQVREEDFPSFETWPERFDLVPIDLQRQIDRRARELAK